MSLTVFNVTAAENNNNNSIIRYAIWSNPSGNFHPTLYFTDYDRAIIFTVFGRLFTLDENQIQNRRWQKNMITPMRVKR